MPICKNCQERFPCRITIDDKERNLARRKYCLDCSPFGRHNTLKLHENQGHDGKERKCTVCGREYQYKRCSGHSLDKCNSCLANRRKSRIKERMVKSKGGKCSRCGYDRCLQALEFHHRDPKTKKFCISGAHCRKWEVVKKELDKCDLVCSNCHKEIEAASSIRQGRINP